jgi:hypothetical protein
MTDIDLFAQLRPEVPLPGLDELGLARSRLTAAITAETDRGVRPEFSVPGGRRAARASGSARRPRAFWRSRQLALTSAAAAAVAGTAAAVLIFTPDSSTFAPGSSTFAAPPPTAVRLTAARLLRNAASAALRKTATPPRPDQFVYTETETAGAGKSQVWLSVNGTQRPLRISRTGSSVPGVPVPVPRPGQKRLRQPSPRWTPCTLAHAEASKCFAEAAYFPDMPTQPRRLLAYLTKLKMTDLPGPAEPPGWLANNIGKAVEQLMGQSYLLPAQKAALYELMAQTPGFTMVRGVRDAIGRTGVGVEWTYQGGKNAIIIGPRTYAYLGERGWPPPGRPEPANMTDSSALIKMAVVNKIDQLP